MNILYFKGLSKVPERELRDTACSQVEMALSFLKTQKRQRLRPNVPVTKYLKLLHA